MRIYEERGSSLVETLIALTLVTMVVTIGVQGFAYLQARSIATAAAEEGVRAAVAAGPAAGLQRSKQVLAAGGGAGARLTAAIDETEAGTRVTVSGSAAGVFPLALLLPTVHASATLPPEQYPTDERIAR
jgi:Tfp pilus assembly protein PilV